MLFFIEAWRKQPYRKGLASPTATLPRYTILPPPQNPTPLHHDYIIPILQIPLTVIHHHSTHLQTISPPNTINISKLKSITSVYVLPFS